MILTDGVHLVSDKSFAELHRFAKLIGLKRCWFHSGTHYDFPRRNQGKLVGAAVQAGAQVVSTREIARRRKK